MAEYLYADDVVPDGAMQDFFTHHLGPLFRIAELRQVTGGRAWVPPGGRPSVYFWQLWRVADAELLAEVDLNDERLGDPPTNAWLPLTAELMTLSEPGPLFLQPNPELYIANTFGGGFFGGEFVFRLPFTYPYVREGGVATLLEGRFETGEAQTVMPTRSIEAAFFADVLLEAPGMTALPGVHTASGTATALTAGGTATALTASGVAAALSATGTP